MIPLSSFYADDFVKVDWKRCQESMYNSYSNLVTAKVACFGDSQCLGVYDTACDKNGPFHLCPIANLTEYSLNSCIYRKKEYSGADYYISSSNLC